MSDQATDQLSFEDKLKAQVLEDYGNAKQYLNKYHKWCIAMDAVYHNAKDFDQLAASFQFPMPIIQKNVDQAVSDMSDKLWYSNRPAAIVPEPDADPADCDAKQEMMDYQDREDQMYAKIVLALRSACLKDIAVAQVDYVETTRKVWDVVDEPVIDEMTGQPQVSVDPATGMSQAVTQQKYKIVEVPDYRGAVVKRIDPINLFFTRDKSDYGDGFPIIIRSFETRDYFDTRTYFFNQDKIEGAESGSRPASDTVSPDEKLTAQSMDGGSTVSKKTHEYLEWQGFVDKFGVLQLKLGWMIARGDDPEEIQRMVDLISQVKEGEKCWAIVGLTDGTVLNRADCDPLQLGKENVIIGCIAPEDEGIRGIGLARLIEAVQKGSDQMTGYLIENLKQTVNSGWVVDDNRLVKEPSGGSIKVNKAGFILRVTGDPNTAAVRVQQQEISEDIWRIIQWLEQLGQDAGGLRDALTGEIDPRANTLGQSQLATGAASLRVRNYLKTFEDTFVRPVYELRNWINSTFIDTDYAFYKLGPSGMAWQKISPTQIKARVRFICESSTRETNKAVLIQQMLQVAPLLPLAQQSGIPVRIDKFFEKLMKSGFAWSDEDVKALLPTLALEETMGPDVINQQMFMNAQAAAQPKQPQGEGGQQEPTEPGSEGEAVDDMMARSRPVTQGVSG